MVIAEKKLAEAPNLQWFMYNYYILIQPLSIFTPILGKLKCESMYAVMEKSLLVESGISLDTTTVQM